MGSRKTLICPVRPGVLLTLASFRPKSALSSDDFPTLLRPISATSGSRGSSRTVASGKLPGKTIGSVANGASLSLAGGYVGGP